MAEIEAKAMAMGKDDDIPKFITTKKLNGANYLAWAHAIKIFLRGKKKSRFLSELPPTVDDKAYDDWVIFSLNLWLGLHFIVYLSS